MKGSVSDPDFDAFIAQDPEATTLEVVWAKIGWEGHKSMRNTELETIREQRARLLNIAREAIKYAHAYGASEYASLVGTQRVTSFIGLTESLIATIEAQIAGESKATSTTEEV